MSGSYCKIYFQGSPGAYSHQASVDIANSLWLNDLEIEGLFSFSDIFERLKKEPNSFWVIPVENSYAGSVHQNLYLLRDNDLKILAEYYLPINHCLASLENDLSEVKVAYSHPQALMQCENFLKENNIIPKPFSDTAWAAKYIKEKWIKNAGAICSSFAAKLYGLNIVAKDINDQKWNTTRFFLIWKNIKFDLKKEKMSIIFRVKDQPAILFKCLWAFATRFINLTKIESIPAKWKPFEYMFWLDIQIPEDEKMLSYALEELKFFTKEIKILWKYWTVKNKVDV